MGMLQLLCFTENREDAASHMLLLAQCSSLSPFRETSDSVLQTKHPLSMFVLLYNMLRSCEVGKKRRRYVTSRLK